LPDPFQRRVGERVAGVDPQIGYAVERRAVGGPLQHGGGVDRVRVAAEAEMHPGDRAERVVTGQHPSRSGWPSGRASGGQQSHRDLSVVRRGGERGVDAGGGEPLPDRVPRIGGAQSVPDEVAQHAGTQIGVVAVGQHDQPGPALAGE
jgi:hypothetical protein